MLVLPLPLLLLAAERKAVEEETEVKRQEHKEEQAKLAAQRKAEADARKKKAEEDAAAAAQKAADDAAAQAEAGAAGQEGEGTAPQEVGCCSDASVCWETCCAGVAGFRSLACISSKGLTVIVCQIVHTVLCLPSSSTVLLRYCH